MQKWASKIRLQTQNYLLIKRHNSLEIPKDLTGISSRTRSYPSTEKEKRSTAGKNLMH